MVPDRRIDPWLVAPEPPAWGSPPLAGPDQPDWRPGWAAPYVPDVPEDSAGRDVTGNNRQAPAPPHAVRTEPSWPVQEAGQTLVTVGATGIAVAAVGLVALGLLRRRL
ncbi:hypothetical protein GCM10009682_04990 [Luedemannella flava]|uniref:LPXTG cell wall anchor domain-containing protein n=1 Tax=Luedemannella flava TaxID=349316 RepID=A0ABP4XK23_9ACTN